MRPDIRPGATVPDYELPGQTRTPRKPSGISRDSPDSHLGAPCPREA